MVTLRITIPLGIGYYAADCDGFLVKDEARADHHIVHPVPADSRDLLVKNEARVAHQS